jgi:hypothetical protein
MSTTVVTPQGYVPEPVNNIQRIVLNAIEDLSEYGVTTAKYSKIENMAVQYYRTIFRGQNAPSLVSVAVNIDYATRVWSFPSDYIQYTRVAYELNGRLWTLGRLNDISLASSPDVCQQEIGVASIPVSGYWLAGGYWNGYQTAYASGGGFNINYYRVYETERFIQFAESLPPGRAIVEYLSAGRGVNGMTLVPISYEYAFKLFIKWQYCLHSPKLAKLAPQFEFDYGMAMWNSNLMKSPNVREYMDEWYRASGFTLR